MHLSGVVCIDCPSHEVVFKPSVRGARRVHINATLNQFNRSVRAFLDQWPFYHLPDDGDDEDDLALKAAADALEESLSAIDPTSVEFQCYWAEIVSGVKFGQFSVEEILGYDREG